ncbi:MAG: hypothetical protein WB998_07605 [Solirubrobacteraceae bacterium]
MIRRAVALVLVLCACWSTSAGAAQSVGLRVAFHPDLPGRSTTIALQVRIDGPGGAPPAPVTSFDLRLPLGMGIASTTLGQANCRPAALIASGLSGCSANARLGFGTASAVVPAGAGSVRAVASLDAVMGPAAENRVEVLWYVQADRPVFAQLVLPSVVEEGVPPFGEELAVSVPLVQAWPEGPDLALETFDSSLGPAGLTYRRRVAGHTIAFHPRGIRIPSACPTGGYQFAVALSFQDGTQATGTYRVPCPGR